MAPKDYSAADLNLAEAARWRALAERLDSEQEHGPSNTLTSYSRRLEALLEDEFDGRGRGLGEKARSAKLRISSGLLAELLSVSALQEQPPAEISVQCERALAHLLSEAADSRPGTADGSLARRQWILHHPTVAGVVQKLQKYDDGLQHVAMMDLDGHLIELRTSKIIRIDPGDRVVLLRRAKHDATEYYNVTQKVGFKPPSKAGLCKVLLAGAGVCLTGIAGIVVTVLLAIRSFHGWGDLPGLLKYLVVGVPSLLAVCAGIVVLVLGMMSGAFIGSFGRAVEKEIEDANSIQSTHGGSRSPGASGEDETGTRCR